MTKLDPAVHGVLDKAMVARIATVSSTGRPHVNPLYFVLEPAEGDAPTHIHLGTATYTLAARNVAANDAVEILFEVERAPADRRIVRMRGRAVVRTDPPLMARYRRAVARKYVVTPAGLWNMVVHPREWLPMRRHMSGGAACVIDVAPSAIEWIDAPDASA